MVSAVVPGCAWVWAWLARRLPSQRREGPPGLLAFADRIHIGRLTVAERAELAELVLAAVSAVDSIGARPEGADRNVWAAGVWEPVEQQVDQLLRVAVSVPGRGGAR